MATVPVKVVVLRIKRLKQHRMLSGNVVVLSESVGRVTRPFCTNSLPRALSAGERCCTTHKLLYEPSETF
eukprot:2971068-Prymnesium_polylepis.1